MVSDLDFKDVSELQKTIQDWDVNVRKLELKARHLDALEVTILPCDTIYNSVYSLYLNSD